MTVVAYYQLGMPENWKIYKCDISGRAALVMINVSYSEQAPIEKLPFLLWFGVYCKNQPEGAFWNPNETEMLDHIEDDLLLTVERRKRGWAVYPLRIATPGIREYYFYADNSNSRGSILDEIKALHPTYRIEADAKLDQLWERYKTFLPSDTVVLLSSTQGCS